jgi:hypothetical protein
VTALVSSQSTLIDIKTSTSFLWKLKAIKALADETREGKIKYSSCISKIAMQTFLRCSRKFAHMGNLSRIRLRPGMFYHHPVPCLLDMSSDIYSEKKKAKKIANICMNL